MSTGRTDAEAASDEDDRFALSDDGPIGRIWIEVTCGIPKADSLVVRTPDDSARWDAMVIEWRDVKARGLMPVLDIDTTPDQVWPYPADVLGFLWSIDPVAGRAPETLTQEQGRLLVAAWVGNPADVAMPDGLYDALDAAGMLRDGDEVPVEPNLETVTGPNGELGDVLHDINVLCATCEHYRGNSRCEAFGGDIPWMIVAGLHDHRKPFPGDGGVQYTPTPGAARLTTRAASPNVR
ncbi:MAG: hypothetical protein ACR2OO_12105 [Thermomicrobiales bacterium]